MEDRFEQKFKKFLPYIIIIGVIYLLLPALLVLLNKNNDNMVFNHIIYVGVFPLTALLCCGHYAYFKKGDFFLTLVAPIFYIPSMFLYGNFRDSAINSIIYLVAYFVCGYLGLLLGEILSPNNKNTASVSEDDIDIDENYSDTQPVEKKKPERSFFSQRIADMKRPERVDVEKAERSQPVSFADDNPLDKINLDTSTTDDDIDAILAEIHARKA